MRGPGTDLFPESIRIEVLIIVGRCMIDSLAIVKFVDAFPVALGNLFKHKFANDSFVQLTDKVRLDG